MWTVSCPTYRKLLKILIDRPTVIADSVNQILAISMSTIRLLQGQIKEYDKAIEKQFSTIPNTLTSVKGIGPVYAAGIIAKVGDVNQFPSQASLAKYAGLTWTQHQSGLLKLTIRISLNLATTTCATASVKLPIL